MAKKVRTIQKGDKKAIKDGILDSVLTILVSIVIVLMVFGGTFYYLLKNDIGGLGEYFRPSIERIPVLKLALPPLPESEDPDDPKHLTEKELINRYNEYRSENKELKKQLEYANSRITALESEKGQWQTKEDEAAAILDQNENTLNEILKQMEQLEQLKKEVDRLIAMGNPDAFASYYEKVDAENAQELYREIIAEKTVREEYKNLAKPYTEMEPDYAAAILTEMGSKDMDLVVNLIEAMNNDVKAEIIENMDPKFAAEVMKSIAEKKVSKK